MAYEVPNPASQKEGDDAEGNGSVAEEKQITPRVGFLTTKEDDGNTSPKKLQMHRSKPEIRRRHPA